MPSPDLLESAGQRAAFRPVPVPPSVDELAAEVGRRRTRGRRAVGGGIAALALVVGLPLGASLIVEDQPADVVTFAADDVPGDATSESAVAVQPADTSTTSTSSTTTSTTTPNSDADLGPLAGIDGENFDLSMNFGDDSFSIEVITGGDAADRAAAAEAAADSTRTVDDETIWLDQQGDETTASAFFDDETFVSVTGPTEDADRVLDLVTEHANGPVQLFELEDFAERFDIPDDIFNGDLEFDFDGDGLPEDLDEFFEDGTFPAFDDEAMNDFRRQMDEFSDCMRTELDRSGDPATIEIPDCDLPTLDGVITPGFSELFDGETFDDLFDEDSLEDLLDDAFDDAEDALKEAEDALEDAS